MKFILPSTIFAWKVCVSPFLVKEISKSSLADFNKFVVEKLGMKNGDKVILTGVVPYVAGQTTNFIKMHTVVAI